MTRDRVKINSKKVAVYIPLTLSGALILILSLFPKPVQSQTTDPEAKIFVGSQQNVGYTVSIDGSQSTGRNPMGDDGDIFGIKTYTWDFGDGSEIQSGDYLNTISHIYDQPGMYTIDLTVTDYFGNSVFTSTEINVGTLPKITVSGNSDSAIQTAIDSLNDQPGIVFLPPGDYDIHNTIRIPTGVILEGAGLDQTRLIHRSDGHMLTISGDHVRITGVEFEGPVDYQAIYCGGKKNVYIDHCDMHGFKYANAITNDCSATFEYNHIHDNPVAGYGYGIMVTSGAYAMIRNNEFSNNRHSVAAGGKSDEPGWNTGYDFIHNHIEKDDNTARDVALDAHAGTQGRIRISDNVIEYIRYGIGLRDGWGEIRRNIFRNVSSYILKFDEPVYSNGNWVEGGGVNNFHIDHNIILNSGRHWRILYATENIYLNCRKIDDLIPYESNTEWNDCGPDLNQDGVTDEQDVYLCEQVILGFEQNPRILNLADVNQDHQVDTLDLQYIINNLTDP